MPDFRCYCEHTAHSDTEITLSPQESQHLVAANRARPGDPVIAFDGKGSEWKTVVATANKRCTVLSIVESVHRPEIPYKIALAQAVPKAKLLEAIIRRSTEIGISEIFPMETERVETKIKGEKEDSKIQKWQAAAIEGAKQSGNPYLPVIHSLTSFYKVLDGAVHYELKLIASLTEAAVSIKKHFENFRSKNNGANPKSAIWLVGPEGDFTNEETDAALSSGFLPVTLGPNVLRCETAAVAALSILRNELD